MSELRQNAATRDWIVIATERAKRPDQFRNAHRRRELPPQDPSCPFCPGNEELTPFETYGVRDGEGRWLVRSVPNKFAAFTLRGSRERHTQGLLRSMDGVGAHEVIIESPRHDQTIGTLPCSQLELVLNCYRERFCALLEDPRIELVTIFRNHGEQAGTSLIHPHSQLISTPAGFELGSGIYISTAYPEQSAGFLRGVVLPPELPPQAV